MNTHFSKGQHYSMTSDLIGVNEYNLLTETPT